MLTVEKQIEKVSKLRDDKDLTFEEIGEELGFSERTARRRYKAAVISSMMESDEELHDFPDKPAKLELGQISTFIPDGKAEIERFKPLTRTGDAVVTADYHIPLHDPGFVNVMIEYARQHKIKNLIIAGDYFNMDSFSSYLPHQPEAAWDIEHKDGNVVMKTLLKTFDEIDVIWGNHDFRLTKAIGFKHSFTECMKWALSSLTESEMSRVRFSDLDYMHYFPMETQAFRICHPKNFSSEPLTVPRKLAPKYDVGIISAHSHHCAMGVASNGKDIILEPGGFFDKSRTEYIQKTSTYHDWVQGFAAFKDGIAELISPIFGNDQKYRKET